MAGWLRLADWPLSIKLVTGLLLVALGPLLIFGYYDYVTNLDALRQNELRNVRQVAGNVAGRIAQLLTDTRRLAAFVAGTSEMVALLEKPGPTSLLRAQAQVQGVLTTNPEIDFVMVMDRAGDALMSTEPSVIGKNYSFREYFASAIQGRPYTTGIIVGASTGASGVFIAQPVKDASGLVIGIVVLRLTDAAIRDLVEDERHSKERVGLVIDGDGVVIYHPDRSWLHMSLASLAADTQKRIAADQRFAKERIESLDLKVLDDAAKGTRTSGAIVYAGRDGRPQVAGFAPVRVHPWTVIISSPEVEFAAPIQQLLQRQMAFFAALASLVAVLALLFARSLTRPILRLTDAARALAAGRFDAARTGIERGDELGVLANTFERMADALGEREHEREIFGRLVSPDVRDKLVSGELKLGGEQLRVAVLFSDIRGFTAISEATGPHETVRMLNEYMTEMTEAIKPWNGYINNFIGDAIVVIFGAPMRDEDNDWRAINAAFDMRERLTALNQRRTERGDAPIDNGIGIASGRVIAGQMGSIDRCVYTVIGDTVNVAARIESMTREFVDHPVLVNDDVHQAVRDRPGIVSVPLGAQRVKGRRAAVDVYAVARGKHGAATAN